MLRHGFALTAEYIFSTSIPYDLECRPVHLSKIENGRTVFCAPHAAAEDLLGALIYARNVLAECQFAKPGQEKAKQVTVLPHIDGVINRARR